MPKLSIIIPTFNSAACIERCLRSIAVQTFSDYEVIVQDGCSSDGTVDQITNFQRSDPGIGVKLAIEKDKGPYDAMNKGVRRATGEWLYFLGSDDELHHADVLRSVMECGVAAAGDVIYGNVRVAGDAGWARDNSVYDGRFDLRKLLSRNICHQAIFYRTRFHREVGEYNDDYTVCADWDFNLRCWSRAPFTHIDLIVAKFRAGGISSGRFDESFGKDFVFNVLRYFRLSPYDPIVNTPAFAGFDEIRSIQRSRQPLRRVARRIRAVIRGMAL